MKHLKLFFACLLMAVLSIGQVWGAEDDTHDFAQSISQSLNNCATISDIVIAEQTYTVKEVIITYAYNKTNSPSFSVSVGDADWGTTTLSKTANLTTYTTMSFTGDAVKAAVTVSFTNNNCTGTGKGTVNITNVRLVEGAPAGGGDDPVAVTGVSLNKASTSIVEGKTETLVATVAPSNASDKSVSWSSDDESVATVDGGIVTAVAAGTATITVTTTDGSFTDECEVTVTEAPAAVNYEKVTAAPSDWSGEYLIVYENGATAYVWTGVDAASCYATATISNDVIAQPEGTSSVTIASMEGGYSILVNGGTNDGKYIQNNGTSNGIKFVNAGVATTLTYENNAVTITCGGKMFRYNNASGNDRFRYFGSAQQVIQLYKKVDGTVKPSADLAFDAAQKLAKVAGTLTAPNLSTADGFDGTVTYASSDEAVVKVNASTGAITEIVAAGKAVITAHSDETENFKEGSASYTIFVAEQAGTNEDPLTEASAKALIDDGCTLTVHVNGLVLSQNSTNFTVTLTNGFQFYKAKDLNNVAFESAYLGAGDEVTAVGALKKFSSTYELDEGCYLTFYEAATTPLTPIANDKDHPYTVAQALAFAAAPTTYDLSDHVFIQGVVYKANSFNSDNGTYNIYIKDAGTSEDDGKFEFFKCSGLYQVGEDVVPFAEGDVQEGDEVIGYGVMTYYSGGSIWEFGQPNQLVSLNRPAVAVTGVELNKESTSLEVGETETLVATVAPANATNKAVTWASDDETVATVDEDGVVTAVAEGTTTITVTTVDGSFTDDCEVTVTAADPTVHHVTFIAGTDQSDETSITKDGITISASTFNNASYYQCYSGAAMTVSSTVGNITKIELTCTTEGTAKYGPGNWDFTGYSYSGANGSWTGSAETVEFGNASQQVRMTLITVTYKEDTRAAAGLAWNPADDIEITVGDAFSAPALQNPNSIDASEISIESSNTSLATVTAGVVSLVADATGTATITATFNGNASYKPATVSYNITVNEASLDNVTFDSSEDHAESGETTITKSGFTLSFTSGTMDGTQAEYRLYKSQTMTLSSTDYLIKKIEFTCTSGNPITGFADATGLDKDNNEWTGESNTVELTASNAQVRMTKIKVFYVEDTRAAAGLAWNPADDIELTVGGAFSAPALLNPNSIDAAEISIESSNTDVATVTAGVVALVADATGEATITATFAGNASYKPATVSYKITVNPAYSINVQPSLNVNFGSVNQNAEVADKSITVTLTGVDAATLTLEGTGASAFTISPDAALTASGDITISASSANIGTFVATLTISDDANNAESKVVNISITVNEVVTPETPVSTTSKWIPATAIEDGMQVLIVGERNEKIYAVGAQTSNNRTAVEGSLSEGVFTPGENTMAFTVVAQEGGTYALQASNGKYLYAAGSGSGKNFLRSQDEVDDNAKWTLSVSSATANGTNTNNKLQLNNSSDIFSCYSSTQKAIQFYVPQTTPPTPATPDYTRDVTNGHYGTICLPKAGTIEGATLYEIGSFESNMIYVDEVGTTLAAGVPYIFYASEAQLNVYYTDKTADDVPAGNVNGLYGFYNLSDEAATFNIPEDAGNYILYNDQYWLVSGRAAYIANYRAYIKLGSIVPKSAAPGRRRVAMNVNGEQVATGFENLNASEKPVKLMIDGNIFILRGEKLYDATGRLVK